jgi:hypothetical protein
MFACWWASPPVPNFRDSQLLGAGGPHRRDETVAFRDVWALVGLTARALVGFTAKSKTSRFSAFGCWWASPPGQNHRASRCLGAGGPCRRVKIIAFCGVWSLVGLAAGSKPSRLAVFEGWWASPPGQNHCVSRYLVAAGLHRRVKTLAFRSVWAVVGATAGSKTTRFTGFTTGSKPLRFAVGLTPGSKPSHFAIFRALVGHRRVKTIAFRNVWALVGLTAGSKPSRFAVRGRWWASPPGQSHCVSRCLDAGGLHCRVKPLAFRGVWAVVGLADGSKPSRFAVFGRWWASPPGQNHRYHRVSRCLGRRVKTIVFRGVWALVSFTAGSKPSRLTVFRRWWASLQEFRLRKIINT